MQKKKKKVMIIVSEEERFDSSWWREVMPCGDILFYFVSKTPPNTDTGIMHVKKKKKKN